MATEIALFRWVSQQQEPRSACWIVAAQASVAGKLRRIDPQRLDAVALTNQPDKQPGDEIGTEGQAPPLVTNLLVFWPTGELGLKP